MAAALCALALALPAAHADDAGTTRCEPQIESHKDRDLSDFASDPLYGSNQRDRRAEELNSHVKCLAQIMGALAKALPVDRERLTLQEQTSTRLQADTNQILRNLADRTAHQGNEPDPDRLVRLMQEQIRLLTGILESEHKVGNSSFALTLGGGGAPPAPKDSPREQMDPRSPIANYFDKQHATMDFAIVTIPDPRIPRHRRAYDNTIDSITQGMLRSEFVLDRYAFPWQKELRGDTAGALEGKLPVADDDSFGLMVFRNDSWRASPTLRQKQALRVLYIIPEAVTYGVQGRALQSAVELIRRQWRDLGQAQDCEEHPVRVFGPSFSGSFDSLLRLKAAGCSDSADAVPTAVNLDVYSSATTSSSNTLIETASGSRIHYHAGAVNDVRKLHSLIWRLRQVGILPKLDRSPQDDALEFRKVAFFSESTVFGRNVCPKRKAFGGIEGMTAAQVDKVADFCERANWIYFPSNIADIRFGVRERQRKALQDAKIENVELDTSRLSLQDGAENGSELPESQQSPLTAVSNQLDLERAIAALCASKPRVVVVIATDVRDRLFLFEEVRSKLPNVLLVDFEADRLLAHPDFINASRGALVFASAELELQTSVAGVSAIHAAPVDNQAILVRAIENWDNEAGVPPARPFLHVVTRDGLMYVGREKADTLDVVRTLGLFCFGALTFTLCIFCVFASRSGRNESPWFPVGGGRQLAVTLALAFVCVGALGNKILGATAEPLLYLALGVFTLYVCAKALSARKPAPVEAGPQPAAESWRKKPRIIPLVFAAVVLALEAVRIFHRTGNIPLQAHLNESWSTGIAYFEAMRIVFVVILLALWYVCAYTDVTLEHRLRVGVDPSADPATRWLQDSYRQETSSWGVLAALGIVLIYIALRSTLGDNYRVTLWGAAASRAAYAGLVVVTLVSMTLFWASLRIVRRVMAWRHLANQCFPKLEEEKFAPLRVASTPMAALPLSCRLVANEKSPLQPPNSPWNCRHEFNERISAEITLYRCASIGAGLSAGAAAWIVYLFPVTYGDQLLLVNLAILVVTGLYFAHNTVRFERDAVLTRLLCNADAETKFSPATFSYVAAPFVGITLLIAITQVPGVLVWSSGLISLLRHTLSF